MLDPQDCVLCNEAQVRALAAELEHVDEFALDTEGDGLFVYQAKLCTMQIAWQHQEEMRCVIVDTLATSAATLAGVLGSNGPRKVLHDLTFDAQLLSIQGVRLAHVRDTSVAGRFLGKKNLGLSALLETELGIQVAKTLQQHDWGKRPFSQEHLHYLQNDVAHLLSLSHALFGQVHTTGITEEVEEETAYKLVEAFALPTKPVAPGYLRIRGLERLGPVEQAIVRRLWIAREALAQQQNVPAFKIANTEVLLQLAARKPSTVRDARAVIRGHAGRFSENWVRSIREGIQEGSLPEHDAQALARPSPLGREAIALRRAQEKSVRTWRKQEAQARGIDEQAVLPGHCVDALIARAPTHLEELASIAAIGTFRIARYGSILLELLAAARALDSQPAEVSAELRREP